MKNDFIVLLVAAVAPLIFAIASSIGLSIASVIHLVALSIIIVSLVPILYALRKNVYGDNLKSGKLPRLLPVLTMLVPVYIILARRYPDFSWRHAAAVALLIAVLFLVIWDGFRNGEVRKPR
ncbi:MAG: hypothetical protein LBG30_04125 [Odoribacteraceae bacterium]|nr:hypothetical protein [Odoribacteraceae bacterium]